MSHILIIDDQASARGLIRSLLEEVGHTIVEAPDGRHAIEALAAPFDLVITDMLMPEVDGLEVVRFVKEAEIHTPILVISGGWGDQAVDLLSIAKKLGADRTLGKQHIRTRLLATVDEMLMAQD